MARRPAGRRNGVARKVFLIGGKLPYFDSLAEKLVKAKDKGAIAAFSPSGLSLNEPAHLYHQALLAELCEGGHERLGDVVLAAQKAYADTGAFPELLSIYHLLGDPAMTIKRIASEAQH